MTPGDPKSLEKLSRRLYLDASEARERGDEPAAQELMDALERTDKLAAERRWRRARRPRYPS